jgi:hypothetical protein
MPMEEVKRRPGILINKNTKGWAQPALCFSHKILALPLPSFRSLRPREAPFYFQNNGGRVVLSTLLRPHSRERKRLAGIKRQRLCRGYKATTFKESAPARGPVAENGARLRKTFVSRQCFTRLDGRRKPRSLGERRTVSGQEVRPEKGDL